MKAQKKLVSLSIIFILILHFISPIVYGINSNYKKYLALGDSIAYGYGLANRDTESYAQIVRQKEGISSSDFSNLGVTGMTCEQFHSKIQTSEYTNAIKNADLITISIGSNELLGIAKTGVAQVTGVSMTSPTFLSDVQSSFTSSPLQAPAKFKALYEFFTSDETKKQMNASVQSYKNHWNSSVSYIKSINPSTTIIATEFYNPYYEVGLANYSLGNFVEEFLSQMNVILHDSSNNESLYKIAKIHDDFNTTNPRITNVNINIRDLSSLNVDPHPNKSGHSIIATRILDVLSTIPSSKKDIKELSFSEIDNYDYTGSAITPKVTIKDGSYTLKEDTDYTLTYTSNVDPGQASIIIKGIGDYEGTVTKTFNILSPVKSSTEEITDDTDDIDDTDYIDTDTTNIIDNDENEEEFNNNTVSRQQINIENLDIEDIPDKTYMGFRIIPDITIEYNNEKLILDTDYTLNYYDNLNVGTAYIDITGIGNYTGSRRVSFKIVPKNISLATISNIDDQTYSGDEITPEILITDGSAQLIKDTDYTVSYSNNSQVGTATINIKGIGNYTGTTEKTFNIIENEVEKAKDISTLDITYVDSQIYTGDSITPEVKIYDDNNLLIKDTDYTLSYTNNISVGTGTITITGIGNYSGSIDKNFTIVRKDINFTKISDISDQVYSGKAITPSFTISNNLILLIEDLDYTIEYSNNVDVGTASITIKGINNYTGTTVKTFNIVSDNKNKNNNNKNNDNDSKGSSNSTSLSNYSKVTDSTTSTYALPYAGIKTILICIISIVVIGGYSAIKYEKNKDIK